MKRKTFVAAALSMLVGLMFGISSAEAGAGMGAGSGATTCRVVLNGGPNRDQVVSIQDPFIGADVVKISALALLCDLPAIGTRQSGSVTGTPIPDAQQAAVACYMVTGADGARIAETVQDPFTTANVATGTQSVTLGAIQFFCVPAALP
jgi:hypothetical protein